MSDLVYSRIPDARLLNDVGKEIVFQLPFNSTSSFQGLFQHIDEHTQELHVESYGVSVTTLEEVFITVQNATETQAQAEAGRKLLQSKIGDDVHSIIPAEVVDVDVGLPAEQEPVKIDESSFAYYGKHFFALFMKRLLYFLRDWKSWIFLYFVPFLFLLCGLLVMYLANSNGNLPLLKLDV
eukprot:gene45063-57299_t